MSLFLCAHSLCRSTSFPLYRTIGLYINMQTFTPNSAVCTYPDASHDNGRTCRGKAVHSSKPASHNNVRARHAGRGWKTCAHQWNEVELDFWFSSLWASSLWSRRCAAVELQCSMRQSTVRFFLLLVCPSSKCMGLNGLCKWMTAIFFSANTVFG